MLQIRCQPDDAAVPFQERANLLAALVAAGIPLKHACGGIARCSTCRVRILEGLDTCEPRNQAEAQMAKRLCFPDDLRLACQTEVTGAVSLRRLVLDAEDESLTSQLAATAAAGADGSGAGVGREKFVAVLFADIQGFTTLSELLPAYDIVHILNRYFDEAGIAIAAEHGEISNYMGDGIMALFGCHDDEEPVHQAVRAALHLLDVAQSIRKYLCDVYESGFVVRVGVHCGRAVVGHIGARGSRRETAIGDTVNTASRLEAANKETGTLLLVSDTVRRHVRDAVVYGKSCELDLRGKSGSVTAHEVTGLA